MSIKITDKQLLLGITLFLLLFSIDSKKEPRGKRTRKKIIRAIKTKLAIYRNVDPVRYLELINAGSDILKSAKSMVESKGMFETAICPSSMLNLFVFKYNDIIDVYEISKDDLDDLNSLFGNSASTLFTVKYSNVLMGEIETYLKDDLRNVSPDMPHICDGEYTSSCLACKYEKLKKDGFEDSQIEELVNGYDVQQKKLVSELKEKLRPSKLKDKRVENNSNIFSNKFPSTVIIPTRVPINKDK